MRPRLTATYRIQLRPDFGFEQAAEIIFYLKELGISHLYTSPYLQAASGSEHGYDMTDPSRVNEELGGAEAHARLCRKLQSAGLGHMIDMVPNHMAIAGRQNPWWWDVLENGPASRYASYFDVDWESSEERWPNKVLLPVLGDHYGRILEDGQLQLTQENGIFVLHYYEHIFPIDPSSLGDLLGRAAEACGSDTAAFLAESHARLPRPTVTARQAIERRHRDKAVLVKLMKRVMQEEPESAEAINDEIERLNGDPEAMDALIDQQNYRLAYWRTASRDLGYRRFFDINELAGLRVEDIEVFNDTHALPISWVHKGWVQGLRIDHPDGLRNPWIYFQRLREACPEAWIVAEKILMPGEKIPSEWPIAGTTGYDFMNLVDGLFIESRNEEAVTRIYEEFTGEETDFEVSVEQCKNLALSELLGSELNRLTSLFVDVCERHRRHRDYTRYDLREALLETAVYFPVYRSYVCAPRNLVRKEDEYYVGKAIDKAIEKREDLDPELFRFLKNLLLLKIKGPQENALAMRFQQLTGPAMAKGVEDTALYRYNRLVALNEVGQEPDRFGVEPLQFHKACEEACRERPDSMLATTTHDTKRSEDVRARLALLSEIPEEWTETVRRWTEHNKSRRYKKWPERNTEYLLYQTLVGAWPISLERVSAYMEKAVREAKMHTSWTQQNEEYELRLQNFIKTVMGDEVFMADLESFVKKLERPGRINSLALTLIKLTAPGVPDVYQGSELWDLSLVDPDNRRPVDFSRRRELLKELKSLLTEDIMARMDEGAPKMWLIYRALQFRRRRPELFGAGASYRPLYAEGPKARHVIAFVRAEESVSVAPRLVMRFDDDWEGTFMELPEGEWRNILTGDEIEGGPVRLQTLLKLFPVGLFEKK